jgi:hypothetical protein
MLLPDAQQRFVRADAVTGAGSARYEPVSVWASNSGAIAGSRRRTAFVNARR